MVGRLAAVVMDRCRGGRPVCLCVAALCVNFRICCDERGLALLLKLSLLVIRASGRSLMLDVLCVLDGLCLAAGRCGSCGL
jgi:hypothetical protein